MGLAESDYQECVDTNDAAVRATVRTGHAHPLAVKGLLRVEDGKLVFIRTISRRPGTRSSEKDFWVFQKDTWDQLWLMSQLGVLIFISFVDEFNQIVAKRELSNSLLWHGERKSPEEVRIHPGKRL